MFMIDIIGVIWLGKIYLTVECIVEGIREVLTAKPMKKLGREKYKTIKLTGLSQMNVLQDLVKIGFKSDSKIRS